MAGSGRLGMINMVFYRCQAIHISCRLQIAKNVAIWPPLLHMYVNARLPLAGGLIKQTTAAADWSVLYSIFQCGRPDPYFTKFISRPDVKLILTVVPILPCLVHLLHLFIMFDNDMCGLHLQYIQRWIVCYLSLPLPLAH